MRMYQMKSHFKGFSKLVNYHSCRFQRRRKMLSNVQSHYRKGKEKTPKNPEIFVKNIISPAFFEPVSADLLLLETTVIAPIWVMIQLEAFLMSLLATVLQLKDNLTSFPKLAYLQSNIIHC